MISAALANEPDLLIADQPTTALDVTIQYDLCGFAKLQSELGMAMSFITHDLGIVSKVANRVCVMKDGEIVEEGETCTVFSSPSHDYTSGCSAELKGTKPPIAAERDVVLSGDDVRVWFPIKKGLLRRTVDHIKAVDGISLNVRQGETVGVVGRSARANHARHGLAAVERALTERYISKAAIYRG